MAAVKWATKTIDALVAGDAPRSASLHPTAPRLQVASRYQHSEYEADRSAGRCRSIAIAREFIELYSENDCHDLALVASIRCCTITKQNAAGSQQWDRVPDNPAAARDQ